MKRYPFGLKNEAINLAERHAGCLSALPRLSYATDMVRWRFKGLQLLFVVEACQHIGKEESLGTRGELVFLLFQFDITLMRSSVL